MYGQCHARKNVDESKFTEKALPLRNKISKSHEEKLPVGIQSFAVLRSEGYLYVDKTDLIYKMKSSGRIYFLSGPRRFGKSLLVSTLDKLFSGYKELFDGLYIYDNLLKKMSDV
jgi:hypothetical protein